MASRETLSGKSAFGRRDWRRFLAPIITTDYQEIFPMPELKAPDAATLHRAQLMQTIGEQVMEWIVAQSTIMSASPLDVALGVCCAAHAVAFSMEGMEPGSYDHFRTATADAIVQMRSPDDKEKPDLIALMRATVDAIDYDGDKNCRPNEMIGAVLPVELLRQLKAALALVPL